MRWLRSLFTPRSARPDDWARTAVIAAMDCAVWPVAFAFTALTEEWQHGVDRVVLLAVIALAAQAVTGWLTGVYRRRYRPLSFEEVGALAVSLGAAGLMLLVVDRLAGPTHFGHRCVWATASAVSLAFGHRYVRRLRARLIAERRARHRTPVIVAGAGDGGYRAIRAMLSAPNSPYRPVALVDDDPRRAKVRIAGVRVEGTVDDLARVARHHHATVLLVAIPSAGSAELRRLHAAAVAAGLSPLVLPPVQQLIGTGTVSEFSRLTDEQMMNRQPVRIDLDSIRETVAGRVVMITGAGGSIGSELSRQVAECSPRALVLVDHDDSLLHAVTADLVGGDVVVHAELADVRDGPRMFDVVGTHLPSLVIHAAALKHVPALEAHPDEGWKTNVVGTANVLAAAEQHEVARFVNISTDKAADPVNVLGRTKRVAERLVAGAARRTGHRYVSVRFGNVIGSRGSVVETFERQIAAGGPVTVTHPDVTRFFMTIREAVRLTLQATVVGEPGEVLILDMGQPVRIADVARQLIEQSGKRVEIVFVGLRPGEKLHEVLVGEGEQPVRRHHPLIDHAPVPALASLDGCSDADDLERLASHVS